MILCSHTRYVRVMLQLRASYFVCLLAVSALTAAPDSACANEDPSQREWKYLDHADVKTGELYPAAFLMSRKLVSLPNKQAEVGNGYIGVSNHPKRSVQVTVSWDVLGFNNNPIECKVSGCQLQIRFGPATTLQFVALRSADSPSVLNLQDPRAFISAAERHVGIIEVQLQTVANGLATYQVTTSSPLRMEKLAGRKK